DLFSDSVSNDLLRFLIKYYRDEFRNLIERLEGADSESRGPNWLEAALCEWASLRMQTLWRTVDGICHAYGHALQTLAKHQTLGDSMGFGEELIRQRLQVVIAMQQYAKFSDPDSSGFNPQHLDAVEAMFSTFGDWLSVRNLEEVCVLGFEEYPFGRRYFSCLIDSSCARHEVGEGHFARAPKFRIELPGFPILGHGKSDNQNCAVIFTRGEILQMIDANQEAYYEASLFLPSALQEFCGPERTSKGRPGIVGFREHIFSAVGLLGRIAADSEFTFGTMIQRTLDWPLNARLHYGHPDLMDKLQVVQQGGVSKGTKGLNLSEDVFAGLDLSLRGGWTVYREYFHVGKGRDMGFMSVLSFYAKVSMGNAEQAITRQWMRLGLHLELPQLLGVFYSHIGFYVNQCLVNRATKAFCFTAAFFTLAGEVRKPFMELAVEMVSSYFGYFYLLFVLASMLPYFAETMLEEGGLSACYNLASSLLACSPIFSAFQSKLMAHFFETTLNYGGAQYIPTGRGLATQREPFVKNFRCFAPTHLYDAMEVVVLLVFSAGVDYGAGFYLCTSFSSAAWVVSPLLFNPRQFESKSQALRDISEWMLWMTNSEPKEEASWCAWQVSLQEVRRNKSLMSCTIGNCRFMAVLCTVALLLSVFPPAATIHQLGWLPILLYCPPFFHGVICLLLSMVFCSSAASRVPYVLMAPLAVVLTVLEMAFLINQVSWSLLFYKYVCLRWMLEAADGIAALRPGRVVLAPLHDACRIWAFSWRFLRDAVIGMAIGLACLAMACIPGLNYLHTLFLFRTRRPKEEGLAEEAEDSTAALVHEDPLVNFFRTFAPECNIGNISPSRASGALRTSRSAPVIS
ncbi:FKS1, partial [Symbiodinium sp. KB8]